MQSFTYFAPTEIIFGVGSLETVGTQAARFGKRALLVTVPSFPALAPIFEKVKQSLAAAGVAYAHFDGVCENPTTDVVSKGAALARACGAEVVIGLGGGSSMDAAKAIAVEAAHPGTAWDYLHYTAGPTEKTLPILAVTTTAGTGSQTTPCAVITRTETKDKSAIWHRNIFPKVAIVDPAATVSMPRAVTAQTGFDAFCHNFEAYISKNANGMTDSLTLEGIRLIAAALPKVVANGQDMEARTDMAWADTLGGLAIASAGVTLPHGLGMQVGGHCPQVTHGQALAAFYPAFARYTWASCIPRFATVARILKPALCTATDEVAAEGFCAAMEQFLQDIGLAIAYKDVGVTLSDLREIADCGQVLGDYQNNPRVATLEEMYTLLVESYER